MKNALKREYVPTPEIMSLVEKHQRIDISQYLRKDTWVDNYTRGYNSMICDSDYLFDDSEEEEEEDSVGGYAPNLMDNRKAEEERMKKLEEFRLNMLKDCTSKKKQNIKQADPILCRQLTMNRAYNTAIPTLLTVNEILVVLLKYTSLETIIRLQRVSNKMHDLIEELVKGLKLPSIRVDTTRAFDRLFLSSPSVIIGMIKANITVIRFKSRHDPWSKKYTTRRDGDDYEVGLNRVTRNKRPSEKRFYETPPALKLIILNVAEREDLDNLIDNYTMSSTLLHVYYCHDVGRSINVIDKIKADINDSSCYKTIASHQLTYDPHGYLFDSLDNYIV